MPPIEFTSVDFQGSQARIKPGIGFENFTWDDLLWAAVTVGRGSWFDVVQHGNSSAYEAVFRACLLKSALEINGPLQRFVMTDSYRNLDPSEKGAVSYFIGLTMSKMFADRFLDVGWLTHLDVYWDRLAPVLRGRSRPDLVGCSPGGDWVVFESKGRTGVPSADDKTKAKIQARRLLTVGGKKVASGVALISYFYREQLQVYWQDPEPDEDNAQSFALDVETTDFLATYYRPLIELAGVDRMKRQQENERPIRIQEADFDLYFEPKVLEHLLRKDFDSLIRWELHPDAKSTALPVIAALPYKKDGVYVKAGDSWNQSPAQQQLFE